MDNCFKMNPNQQVRERFQVNQILKNKEKEELCHKLINLEQLNQNIL